jgi:hypothetical protein
MRKNDPTNGRRGVQKSISEVAMRRLMIAIATVASCAGPALAQPDQVTEAERAHAGMMILLLVVGGLMLVFLLLWWLRAQGKLPEEKPVPRPLWVHPEDDDRA